MAVEEDAESGVRNALASSEAEKMCDEEQGRTVSAFPNSSLTRNSSKRDYLYNFFHE